MISYRTDLQPNLGKSLPHPQPGANLATGNQRYTVTCRMSGECRTLVFTDTACPIAAYELYQSVRVRVVQRGGCARLFCGSTVIAELVL
jgi:hypothetical protein